MSSEVVLKEKQAIVDGLKDQLVAAKSVVLTGYKGLTVAQDTELRRELREAGVSYHVVKNTMLRRAAEAAGIEGLDEVLSGTTAFAFSTEDAVAPAKVICDFMKKNKLEDDGKLFVKIGMVEGKVISVDEVKALAALPSREELLHPCRPARFSSRRFLAACRLLSAIRSTYCRVSFATLSMCLTLCVPRRNLPDRRLIA